MKSTDIQKIKRKKKYFSIIKNQNSCSINKSKNPIVRKIKNFFLKSMDCCKE